MEADKLKKQQETDEQMLKDEQGKQAAADLLWKAKLIAIGVSAIVGIISGLVMKHSSKRNAILQLISVLILYLIVSVTVGAIFQSWSLFFVILWALIFFGSVTYLFLDVYEFNIKSRQLTFYGKVFTGFSLFCLALLLIALFV